MLTQLVAQAESEGIPLERLGVAHADLGRVEWAGTKELAAKQAGRYGLRFETVSRDRDLLHQVEHERRMWPSSTVRFCTSDHKAKQVAKLITALVAERCEGRPV